MKDFYTSDRCFKLWAYTLSHSSLLIRSEMKYPDQDDYSENTSYNIDLEFWSVQYIDIPSSFNGITIKEITSKQLPKRISLEFLKYNMKIFELQSKGLQYYIIAGGLLVGKNRWENQDRVFNYNSNLEHEEIIYITKK